MIFLSLSFFAGAPAQTGSSIVQADRAAAASGSSVQDTEQPSLRIYPVPVKENNFHVTSEKEISLIRVTNIIGQEIYKNKFSPPVMTTQVYLTNTQRGMYLVTIIFSDNTRTVRKIMVESMQ